VTLSALALALAAPPPRATRTVRRRRPRGEIVTYLVDYDDHSETQHLLRLPGGEERPLILEGNHELAPGDRVRLWGTDQGDAIKVIRSSASPTRSSRCARR
jgi:hypothetical protein